MVTDFFEATSRTITNVLNNNEEKVNHNGFRVLNGQKLKKFKEKFGPLLTVTDDLSQKETDFPLLDGLKF